MLKDNDTLQHDSKDGQADWLASLYIGCRDWHHLIGTMVKGIFSDSNDIYLWYESEDIKKSLNPKFQLIPILRFQVMHDYVCFIASIDYCVK